MTGARARSARAAHRLPPQLLRLRQRLRRPPRQNPRRRHRRPESQRLVMPTPAPRLALLPAPTSPPRRQICRQAPTLRPRSLISLRTSGQASRISVPTSTIFQTSPASSRRAAGRCGAVWPAAAEACLSTRSRPRSTMTTSPIAAQCRTCPAPARKASASLTTEATTSWRSLTFPRAAAAVGAAAPIP